jgi:preprotein translocase subunit YajC
MDFPFFLFLFATLGVMYFLLVRPRQQEQRRHMQMLAQLKVGDEVITSGGIYGEVTELDAHRVMLEVDENVRIAVDKRAIASVVPPEELARLEGEEGATADEPLTAEERVEEQSRT